MAAIHDLLKQIPDIRLRERIAQEWEAATRHKKFGLVYERHLPELVPLWNATPRRGDLVALRGGKLTDIWQVRRIEGQMARLIRRSVTPEREAAAEREDFPLADLFVIKQFGEPIFPTLTPVDAVQNGPDGTPWHLLIEADNLHALQILEYLYAGKVDCIYIDPPYNTGARDWKYNNDYVDKNDEWRHSKWLALMERRLLLSKRLLNAENSALILTIDENELAHIRMLIDQIFPAAIIQVVTSIVNPRGVFKSGNFSRCEEYIFFVMIGSARVSGEADSKYLEGTEVSWRTLRRSDLTSARGTPKGGNRQFYPIYVNVKEDKIQSIGEPLPFMVARESVAQLDDCVAVFPIRPDGTEMNWGLTPESLRELWKLGYVKLGAPRPSEPQSFVISYLTSGRVADIAIGRATVVGRRPCGAVIAKYLVDKERMPLTSWFRPRHNAETFGSNILRDILGDKKFPFPKSVYAVADCLRYFTKGNRDALIVDFFAGSGTTAHAVMLLNNEDQGSRRCIMVTNNEVSSSQADALIRANNGPGDPAWEAQGICRSVTWPRSKFTIKGRRDDGTPLAGDCFTGRMMDRETPRTFRHLSFVSSADFRLNEGQNLKRTYAKKEIARQKKALVSLIGGIPQSAVSDGCQFIAREGDTSTVLFDPAAMEEWIAALDEQGQKSHFFVITDAGETWAREQQFDSISEQVEEILGARTTQEEERRPMAEGFAANLAYFKLGFLDKDRVELGAAFREILPLLWMRAGAIGPMPKVPEGPLPDWFAPTGRFAVLLAETRIRGLLDALKGRMALSHVFIVTDAEEAFRALSEELRAALVGENPEVEMVQLYRDYLTNFTINTRVEDAPIAQGGEP